jgi:uncharacterized protein YbjT (DUF2867 family)
MKAALLAGSTGLIGGQLLVLLLKDDRYTTVIAVSRKPLAVANPKLRNVVADLTSLEQHKDELAADDVFCCLGTTMLQAKTKEAFSQVDFDYPVLLARLSRERGAKQYLLVSALGANKSSFIFYNRVKGLTEEAIAPLGFEGVHILRPSLLVGPRTEHRAGEDAVKWFYRAFGFLIPKKYKAIESIKVARSMLVFAKQDKKGNFVHDSNALQDF